MQAYGVTGELDAVLIGHLTDMEEYQALCDRLFDRDPNVTRHTTLFAVENYKETTDVEPFANEGSAPAGGRMTP